MSTKTAEKKEFKMEQAFALWKRTSKKGGVYFSGKFNGNNIMGFYNTDKKNPKEPDVRLYQVDEDGKMGRETWLSLWCDVSKGGKKYLSGKLNGRRVVGFINEKADDKNKQPYVSIYYSGDEQKKVEPKKEEKDKFVDYEQTNLPF